MSRSIQRFPDLNATVEELQRQINEKLKLPKGYKLTIEGEYQAKAKQKIIIMSVIVLMIVTFLLFNYFKSVTFVLLVLSDIPIVPVGEIIMTKYTIDTVRIATLVGFIGISGISARHSIMVISHYLHLMKQEGESPLNTRLK